MKNYFEDVCKVLNKLTENRAKDFRMNLKSMLYMGVPINNYRNEIISKSPPVAIKILGFISKAVGIIY